MAMAVFTTDIPPTEPRKKSSRPGVGVRDWGRGFEGSRIDRYMGITWRGMAIAHIHHASCMSQLPRLISIRHKPGTGCVCNTVSDISLLLLHYISDPVA